MNLSATSPQHLLSLFGRPGAASPQLGDQAATIARLAREAKTNEAHRVAGPLPAASGSQGIGADLPIVLPEGQESREEYEASVAAARTRMEAWEANEQALEKQNGFRRQVNSMLEGSYAAALSGRGGTSGSSSHQEAQDLAARVVGRVWGQIVTSNSDTKVLNRSDWVEQMAASGDLAPGQMTAKIEDDRKAAQMNMFIETVTLNKSLEVTGGPLYAKQDGYYSMNNVEVRSEGKLVLTVEEHGGKITLFDADGTTRDLGAMHQIAENQPGAYSKAMTG